MLEFLRKFIDKNPSLLKRVLLGEDRIIAWSINPSELIMEWKKQDNFYPLRIVPNYPQEGGITQLRYNQLWDKAKSIEPKIRKFTSKDIEELLEK